MCEAIAVQVPIVVRAHANILNNLSQTMYWSFRAHDISLSFKVWGGHVK